MGGTTTPFTPARWWSLAEGAAQSVTSAHVGGGEGWWWAGGGIGKHLLMATERTDGRTGCSGTKVRKVTFMCFILLKCIFRQTLAEDSC